MSRASRAPKSAASVGGRWRTSVPTGRRPGTGDGAHHSSSPSSPSATSASAPDGRGAAALEGGQDGPLGGRGAGRGVVERRERGDEVVAGAALDGEGALPGGPEASGEDRAPRSPRRATEAGQAGAGQHDGVVLTGCDLADPGVDVAADVDDLEAKAERGELGSPARRPGADAAADGQLAEGEAVAGDDDVARVLAEGYGGQRDAWAVRWAGP